MLEMAGGQGFEPWLAESESAVLPLDDPPQLYITEITPKDVEVILLPHSLIKTI